MLSGVTIGGKHCYNNFRLIMKTKNVGIPDVKKITVNVPFRDGAIDLTDSFGRLRFDTRKIIIEFLTLDSLSNSTWAGILSDISNKWHGKQLQIIFDDDPSWHYLGRLVSMDFTTNGKGREFKATFDCEPYKYKNTITSYTATAGTSVSLVCANSRMPVCPTIINTQQSTIVFNNKTVILNAGTHKTAAIEFVEGDNSLAITSTGTTRFEYNEGSL